MHLYTGRTEFLFRGLLVEAVRLTCVDLSSVAYLYLAHCLQKNIARLDILAFRVVDHMSQAQQHPSLAHRRDFYLTGAEACLLLTGLFPEVPERRHMSVGFYVEYGKMLYHTAGRYEPKDAPYPSGQLAQEFEPMAKTLRGVRALRNHTEYQL